MSKGKIKPETVEIKLRNIVDSNKPKSITIDGKKYYISKDIIKHIKLKEEKNGGFLPLIPLILGGLAAAGGVASGSAAIASAVNKKKAEDAALKEQRRHNQELEKLAKGKGLEKDIRDFAKRSGLEDQSKRFLKNTLYNLANTIHVEKQGSGLYLQPFPTK